MSTFHHFNNVGLPDVEFSTWWYGDQAGEGFKDWFDFDLDESAVEVLKDLNVELRMALLDINTDVSPVRKEDLNWEKYNYVKGLMGINTNKGIILRALELPPFLARMLLGMDSQPGADHPVDNSFVSILCPQYPKLDITYAYRICKGEKPKDICLGLLTSKEAHEYFIQGGPNPLLPMEENVYKYLISFLPKSDEIQRIHYLEVVRWLIFQYKKGNWPILTKNRLIHGAYMGTYLEYIDELEPDDLTQGLRTGIHTAFENAHERIVKNQAGSDEILTRNVFGKLPYGINLLNTSNALLHEGKYMQHCVGSYTRRVKEGKSYIFSIRSLRRKSTLELVRENNKWVINQHKGFRNSEPCERHRRLVELWVKKLNND